MGCSRKLSWNFSFFYFTPRNSRKPPPGNSICYCLIPLEIPFFSLNFSGFFLNLFSTIFFDCVLCWIWVIRALETIRLDSSVELLGKVAQIFERNFFSTYSYRCHVLIIDLTTSISSFWSFLWKNVSPAWWIGRRNFCFDSLINVPINV